MNIQFETVIIHHFLSFGDSEINLSNRGYCLVSGINHNPKDAAVSNGSGKSSIWSAICWALTGETIQGLSSNLANVYFDDGCWVELHFKVDDKQYKIIRSKDDSKLGTDLKIYINNEDKSGKGIRESEALLAQYLPDITSELIGSVIILGQGLPHKFSDNTPSGRKETLEKLSKSDFMIQDIKDRITKRSDILSQNLRKEEDDLLTNNTQANIYNSQLSKATADLVTLEGSVETEENYNKVITENENLLKQYDIDYNNFQTQYNDLNKQMVELHKSFASVVQLKDSRLEKVRQVHDANKTDSLDAKTKINSNIYTLEAEIRQLKSITDICPTCHQHIPNVIKPDTTEKEKQLTQYKVQLDVIINDMKLDDEDYNKAIANITQDYNVQSEDANKKIQNLTTQLNTLKKSIDECEGSRHTLSNFIQSTKSTRDNYLNNKKQLEDKIKELKGQVDTITSKIGYINNEKTDTEKHIEVVNKMMTSTKRDFRGFLLTNVIDFISSKAKEYCSYVFDTDEIKFALDGNNIIIEFCGKAYENLSGGEKQKVDLILQFAIRDMMCTYLGFSSNILILDEITDNLDAVGCDRILNLISKKLTDIESIFIISHRSSDLAIPYDYELIVEKNSNGVSEVKE